MSKTPINVHLRQWGLKVTERDGWHDRRRPFTFKPKAVICHHTASGSQSGNFGSADTVTFGRSDLPGPLCQFLLGRDGTVEIIAAGYANHAGFGGPRAGIPANMGNTYAYGIEAENNGLGEKWTKEQLNAYYRLCAALLAYMGTKDVSRVIGHKEWAPGRKIDPAGIDMNGFRKEVAKALAQGPSVTTVRLSRLKPGNRNKDVILVKKRLRARGHFNAKNNNNYFGKGLQDAVHRFQRAQGWHGQDADGIPGKTTLQKLGFRVLP